MGGWEGGEGGIWVDGRKLKVGRCAEVGGWGIGDWREVEPTCN